MDTSTKSRSGRPIVRPALILIAIASVLLLCKARAVSPPPDGGYPGGNTAEGAKALLSLTTGGYNTAVGWFSLKSNTQSSLNTAVGAGTLVLNSGDENTATGAGALLLNTIGHANTANGAFALFNNAAGVANNAVGDYALYANQNGGDNNAVGVAALSSNISGSNNTAVGDAALGNCTGDSNTALGATAGSNATTGNGNLYLGAFVQGVAGESNHTYIGNIKDTPVSGGGTDTVTVDLSTGLLGHLSSSRRYKEDIQSMESASETLYRLKPVRYRFKKEIDPTESLDYGLVAEEVAAVDPNLAIRNGKGQIESVRYNAVSAMLLNEFLKEHRRVRELSVSDADQKKQISSQENRIVQLTSTVEKQETLLAQQQRMLSHLVDRLETAESQIQNVSAQLDAPRSAPQVAATRPLVEESRRSLLSVEQ